MIFQCIHRINKVLVKDYGKQVLFYPLINISVLKRMKVASAIWALCSAQEISFPFCD